MLLFVEFGGIGGIGIHIISVHSLYIKSRLSNYMYCICLKSQSMPYYKHPFNNCITKSFARSHITWKAKTSLAMPSHFARPSRSLLISSLSKPNHTCTMTSPGDHQPQKRISVLSPPDNEASHPLSPSRLAHDKEHPTSAKPTLRVSTSHMSRNLHGERVSIAP